MTRQAPFIASIIITATGTAQQYTDPNAAVPPAAGAGSASEPVQQSGVRAIHKLFQEVQLKATGTNAAVIKYGMRVGGVIQYATLVAGEARKWSGSDLRNVPLDLSEMWFIGTANDVIEVTGLPNRQ